MILGFNIEYKTAFGEEVKIRSVITNNENNKEERELELQTADGICWRGAFEINNTEGFFEYFYCVYEGMRLVRTEWRTFPRRIFLSDDKSSLHIYDAWRDTPEQEYFYSSAFTKCLFSHSDAPPSLTKKNNGITIKAFCPDLDSNYQLGICGNCSALGDWNPVYATLLSGVDFPQWEVDLNWFEVSFPLEYKFVLYNKKEKKVVAWEQGNNRFFSGCELEENEKLLLSDHYVKFEHSPWKAAGVAIPIFSLRSEDSFGIGDFDDLKKMVAWAASTGQKIVQILPINDTTMTHTWEDSYPYNAISIYALHPMNICLNKVGMIQDKLEAESFEKERKRLNDLAAVEYEEVEKLKWSYIQSVFRQNGIRLLESEEFKEFFSQNTEWLTPYAAFCYLREVNNTPDFRKWLKYSTFNRIEIEELCKPGTDHYKDIAIHYYIQYNLHLQLLEVSRYARSIGVVLKGDIPIGISRNSVEAWTEPHYFNMDGQAGAPPDNFSVNGQNWGFPTYDWDVMKADGYYWWTNRFRKMATYFDAYRIDHILGFFRIWEIPTHSVHGLLGQFVPALPMSRGEIESYGLHFDEHLFLTPFINDLILDCKFGEAAGYVRCHFLHLMDANGMYEILPDYDTQRKVEDFFKNNTDEKSLSIRDGIYSLINNVLFVRDRKEPDKYHPRIGVQQDFVYKWLDEKSKKAFDHIYEHFFYYRHNEFWYDQAMQKLPRLIHATQMLVCGEDLGMVPECVEKVMNQLHILTLEIEHMPKEFGVEFGNPEKYPYPSVCTFSTHDMSTLRGWWQEDKEKTERYLRMKLAHNGNIPKEADAGICSQIIAHQLKSNSMLAVMSFQDWMSVDDKWRGSDVEGERINIPANPRHYWRYRMHLTIEKLMKADTINEKIKELIRKSGRNSYKLKSEA